jgi:hypothetical protein
VEDNAIGLGEEHSQGIENGRPQSLETSLSSLGFERQGKLVRRMRHSSCFAAQPLQRGSELLFELGIDEQSRVRSYGFPDAR